MAVFGILIVIIAFFISLWYYLKKIEKDKEKFLKKYSLRKISGTNVLSITKIKTDKSLVIYDKNEIKDSEGFYNDNLIDKYFKKTESTMRREFEKRVAKGEVNGLVAVCEICNYKWDVRQKHSIPSCPKCHKHKTKITWENNESAFY